MVSFKKIAVATLILTAALAGMSKAQDVQSLAVLEGIAYQKVDARLEVIIKVAGNYRFEVQELAVPRKLAIDFSPVEVISADPMIQVNELGILNIRTGHFQPQVARVVFDFSDEVPAHSLAQVPEGIKISFWLEEREEVKEEAKEEKIEKPEEPVQPEVVPKEPEKKEITMVPVEEARPRYTVRNFFLNGNLGLLFFLKPDLSDQTSFSLYSETASLAEAYHMSSNISPDLSAGKYIAIGRITLKLGAGFSLLPVKYSGGFSASLPHPFTANSSRTVTFDEKFKHSVLTIYLYGLFPVYEHPRFEILLGPLLGLSKGKFTSLDDISFTEKSPFESKDIQLTSKTYIRDSFSTLSYGALAQFEYLIHKNISAIFTLRMLYFNPIISNLGLRGNFLQVNSLLGLQANF